MRMPVKSCALPAITRIRPRSTLTKCAHGGDEEGGRDAAAGKTAAANCATCHGATGVSASGAIPNLAGQKQAYLANALRAYKSNARSNGIMSAMASSLSDSDIENVSAYYAKNSCKTPSADKGKAAAGKAKYAASGCAACHSSGGLRNPGLAGVSASQAWPNLAGQNAENFVVH
jgi:cytochrome c553